MEVKLYAVFYYETGEGEDLMGVFSTRDKAVSFGQKLADERSMLVDSPGRDMLDYWANKWNSAIWVREVKLDSVL
jgi:hypothetical protein